MSRIKDVYPRNGARQRRVFVDLRETIALGTEFQCDEYREIVPIQRVGTEPFGKLRSCAH